MSVGHREGDRSNLAPTPEDWLLSDKDIKLVIDDMHKEINIVNSFDIPYTAGYSEDAKTVYMDKEVPEFLKIRSRESRLKEVEIPLWVTFSVHEMVEKSLEDVPYYWLYSFSHEIATRAERLFVESLGGDWNDYNTKTLALVNKIMNRKEYKKIPKNLDLQPYIDSKDTKILKKMGLDENGKTL